jgi:hypothetical protein
VDKLNWVCAIYLGFLLLGIIWNLIWPIVSPPWTDWRRNHELSRWSFDPIPAPRLVVTLVHGTWAMTSEWTRPRLKFVKALERALAKRGATDVQFDRFLWSGGNTFAARKRAQDKLACHIRGIAAKHPDVPHYIVSHSHGGNVALAALRDLMEHGGDVPVQGVACLGTPFLIRARRDDPPLEQLLALGSGPFIATLLLALQLARDVDGLLRPGPFLTAGVAGAVVGMTAMYLAHIFAVRRAKPTLLRPKSLPKALADRLLIIRSRGDEAAAGLGIGYFVGWAVRRLWLWVYQHIYRPFDRVYKTSQRPRAVYAQRVAATTIAFIVLPIPFVTEYQEWLIAIWAELPVVIVVFILLVLLLWFCILGRPVVAAGLEMMFYVPLNLLLGVFAMPFAPELILSSAYLDISAEPTPVGRHLVLKLKGRPGDLKPRGPGGLSHSTYDDVLCPPAIACWICESNPASYPSTEDNQHEGDRRRDVLPSRAPEDTKRTVLAAT